MPQGSKLKTAVADLATANHILFDQGIVDAFGHVSARHPDSPVEFLLSRNRAPALVAEDDILTFDLDGRVVGGSQEKVYLERFIHGEIYRKRPDVMAVVHSHTVSVLPFTIVPDVALCPVCHTAGFIRRGTPVFEIRCHAGDNSDLLIRTQELGRHLAACLADHPVALMRGHGMTVVGNSLRQAVARAVYTEVNARVQITARALGSATFLTEGEAAAAAEANDGQVDRAWDFWALNAEARIASLRTG